MSQSGDGLGIGPPLIELPLDAMGFDKNAKGAFVIVHGVPLAFDIGEQGNLFLFGLDGSAPRFLGLRPGGQGGLAGFLGGLLRLSGQQGGVFGTLAQDIGADGILFGFQAEIAGGMSLGLGGGQLRRQLGIEFSDRLVMGLAVTLAPLEAERRHGM